MALAGVRGLPSFPQKRDKDGTRAQFVVSEKVVVCCSEPDAAITVTVDVVEVGPEPLPAEPPQPLRSTPPMTAVSSSRERIKRRRFFRPKRQNITASAEPGKSRLRPRSTVAVAAEVETVSIVEIAVPTGVTVDGEKLHDAPVGSPEQLNETAELNPFSGATEIDVATL